MSALSKATSLASWKALLESGAITRNQARAYRIIAEHGPLAEFELHELDGSPAYRSPRVSQLLALGLIVELNFTRYNPATRRQSRVVALPGHPDAVPLEVEVDAAQAQLDALVRRVMCVKKPNVFNYRIALITALTATIKQHGALTLRRVEKMQL